MHLEPKGNKLLTDKKIFLIIIILKSPACLDQNACAEVEAGGRGARTLWGTTFFPWLTSVQSSSVAQSYPILCDPMNHSRPGFPVCHQLRESTQTHVHRVGDAIQPSHPLLSPFPPALNLSQHQGLSKWVSSSYQVAKGLEFQLHNQYFQWTPKTDLL